MLSFVTFIFVVGAEEPWLKKVADASMKHIILPVAESRCEGPDRASGSFSFCMWTFTL